MANARSEKALCEGFKKWLARETALRVKNTQQKRHCRVISKCKQTFLSLQLEFPKDNISLGPSYQCLGIVVTRVAKPFAQTILNSMLRVAHFSNKKKSLIECSSYVLCTNAMLRYVQNYKKLLARERVCDSVVATWKDLKYGRGKDNRIARNAIVAAIVSVDYDCVESLKVAAKAIGLNRRALQRIVCRMQMLDDKDN